MVELDKSKLIKSNFVFIIFVIIYNAAEPGYKLNGQIELDRSPPIDPPVQFS